MANVFFSSSGQALATFLHTLGAIGYLAGIAFYIAWRRHLLRGDHNPSILATGAALTYVSILANLVGGFLRTYAPGHPGLTQMFDEPWVAVMAIKHIALFVGMFAAAFLFEVVAPRLKKRFDAGELEPASKLGRASTQAVVWSIVVAAVLGGAATAVPIGGATADDDGPVRATPPEPLRGRSLDFQGSVSSASPATGSFDVGQGARHIWANLTASDVGGTLPIPYAVTVTITDPIGAQHSATTPQDPQAKRVARIELATPLAGTWGYQISTDAGVEAPWSLDVDIQGQTILEGEVTIPAGEFFEINTQAAAGDKLHWDWSSDHRVDWNIHSHADGQAHLLADDEGEADAGTVTVQQDGGHSYFWAADEDVVLRYQVWGEFEVDSVVRSWE